MFVSFKLRDGECEQGGRFFNGYNQGSFQELIKKHLSFVLLSNWTSDEVRPDRKQRFCAEAQQIAGKEEAVVCRFELRDFIRTGEVDPGFGTSR